MKPKTVERLKFIVRATNVGLSDRDIGARLGTSHQAISALRCKYITGATPASGLDVLYDRWLNVHDIRAMGEHAVRETS